MLRKHLVPYCSTHCCDKAIGVAFTRAKEMFGAIQPPMRRFLLLTRAALLLVIAAMTGQFNIPAPLPRHGTHSDQCARQRDRICRCREMRGPACRSRGQPRNNCQARPSLPDRCAVAAQFVARKQRVE
jgi:hypothetical protein